MNRQIFSDVFNTMKVAEDELRKQYINKYLEDRTSSPSEYHLDVKAYCVFCHAAIEYMLESWSLAYADLMHSQWQTTKQPSFALVALCLYYASGRDAVYNRTAQTNYNSIIETGISDAFQRLRTYIRSNQGISSAHVRKLFWPLGIDFDTIVEDMRYKGALDQLKKHRGDYAHRYDRANLIAPETALTIIRDCLEMLDLIQGRLTNAAFPGFITRTRLIQILRSRILHATGTSNERSAKLENRSQ